MRVEGQPSLLLHPCYPVNPSHRCRSDSGFAADIMMKTTGVILLLAILFVLPVEGLDPPPVRPGVCPTPSKLCAAPVPSPKCTQDSDCPGTQKCCTPVCTQECTDITTDKPGQCPVSSSKCPSPPPPPKCKQDSDCPGAQKCCTPDCTQECTTITKDSSKA
ncbi:uncharacterized protein LOC144762020 isoform X2 [Lissotriton helveticus]